MQGDLDFHKSSSAAVSDDRSAAMEEIFPKFPSIRTRVFIRSLNLRLKFHSVFARVAKVGESSTFSLRIEHGR